MEVYDHCYHQLNGVLQDMDYCISAEDMSDAERAKLQRLYDGICSELKQLEQLQEVEEDILAAEWR